MQAITPAQLDDWVRQETAEGDATPVVLDVREPWELQTASVAPGPGYELLAMPMRSVPARLSELDRDRPIAVLCHHGGRSAQVARFLLDQGYARVVNVHGGNDLWSRERDPSIPRY
jgi:rhodanese-related sulfurtransferase